MSNTQHLAQLKEGRITALCGYHRKKRDWEGVWTVAKVDCPHCIRKIEERAAQLPVGGNAE